MYIEDIIIDNLIINFTILFVTNKILKLKAKNIFLISGSIVGTILTIVYCYFKITGIQLLLFKIFTSILMVIVSFNYKKFRSFILSYLSFIFVTALMGGVCFFIAFTFGETVISNGAITYDLGVPMGIIIFIVLVVSYFVVNILKAVNSKNKIEQFIYDAKITNKNKQIKLKAFLDTGNTLKDYKTGKPVFILTYKNFYKLFNVSVESLIQGKVSNKLEDAHYLDVGGVGRNTKMLVFTVDELEVKKEEELYKLTKPILALSYQNLEQKLNCGLLLNSKFKEYIK